MACFSVMGPTRQSLLRLGFWYVIGWKRGLWRCLEGVGWPSALQVWSKLLRVVLRNCLRIFFMFWSLLEFLSVVQFSGACYVFVYHFSLLVTPVCRQFLKCKLRGTAVCIYFEYNDCTEGTAAWSYDEKNIWETILMRNFLYEKILSWGKNDQTFPLKGYQVLMPCVTIWANGLHGWQNWWVQ